MIFECIDIILSKLTLQSASHNCPMESSEVRISGNKWTTFAFSGNESIFNIPHKRLQLRYGFLFHIEKTNKFDTNDVQNDMAIVKSYV